MNTLELFTMVISATTPNEIAVEKPVFSLSQPSVIWSSHREKKQLNEFSILVIDKKKNKGVRIRNNNKINLEPIQ